MNIDAIGLIDDDDILLDIAALALSREDHGDVEIGQQLMELEAIEERICKLGKSAALNSERAMVLVEVLNDELGFRGDSEGYDAPVNADFLRVLERRRGLPISLAILYVAMARRAGWAAHVLNVPGHVLVQIGERTPVLIDPFNGGRRVDQTELERICRFYIGDESADVVRHARPATNRQALTRLLSNQAARAESAGDQDRALEVYERMTRIAPATTDAWSNLARLQRSSGDRVNARRSLLAMTEITMDPATRTKLFAAFADLGKGVQRGQ